MVCHLRLSYLEYKSNKGLQSLRIFIKLNIPEIGFSRRLTNPRLQPWGYTTASKISALAEVLCFGTSAKAEVGGGLLS